MKLYIAILILFFAMSATANAQHGPRLGVATNFGYSRSEFRSGFGLAAGGSFRWAHFLSFAMADFTLVRKPGDSRYYLDTFPNGQQRCRDRTNGQFARTELCSGSADVITAGMFDANIIGTSRVPIIVGGGYRVGPGRGGYVSFGYARPTSTERAVWFIKGSVGKDIIQAHIGIAAHWP